MKITNFNKNHTIINFDNHLSDVESPMISWMSGRVDATLACLCCCLVFIPNTDPTFIA